MNDTTKVGPGQVLQKKSKTIRIIRTNLWKLQYNNQQIFEKSIEVC